MKIPPVIVQMVPDGVLLFAPGKQVCMRMLSWKELEKLAKKGKKKNIPDMMKEATKQLGELIKRNQEWENNRIAAQEKLKEIQLRYTRRAVPSGPMPSSVVPPPIIPPPPPVAP